MVPCWFVCYSNTCKRLIGSLFLDVEDMFTMIWLKIQEYTKFILVAWREPHGQAAMLKFGGSQPETILFLRGYLTMSRDILDCLKCGTEIEARILLNIQQCTGQPLQKRIIQTQVSVVARLRSLALMLTSYIAVVHPSKPRNQHGSVMIN